MQAWQVADFERLGGEGYTIIDVRSAEDLFAGIIPGSISVQAGEGFLERLAEVLEDEEKFLLVTSEEQRPALERLVKGSGLSTYSGYLQGGYDAWVEAGKPIDVLIIIEADELKMDYQFDEFYLIDVRTPEEFAEERLEDAENVALADLVQALTTLDANQSYYVYGAKSADALTAGSLFKRAGFERVRIVADDYEQIKQAGIPLYKKKKEKPGSKSTDI